MSAQYFAQLDANNIVTHVAVVTQEFMEANPERYQGTWVETFITAGKTYAGVSHEYLPATQDFREQQPYPSWTWANNIWQAPTPQPVGNYRWSEKQLAWILQE